MQYLDSDAKFPDIPLDSFIVSVSAESNEASARAGLIIFGALGNSFN